MGNKKTAKGGKKKSQALPGFLKRIHELGAKGAKIISPPESLALRSTWSEPTKTRSIILGWC
jgi:hypothetical protein